MTMEQALSSLLSEVEAVLKTPLPPQRQLFFEGARHYLRALEEMSREAASVKRRPRTKKALNPEGKDSHESEA
jgi:hypothetical protein